MERKISKEVVGDGVIMAHKVFDAFIEQGGGKPCFSDEAFKAGVQIFAAVMADKMDDLQMERNMELDERIAMSGRLGEKIKTLISVYTGIDTKNK